MNPLKSSPPALLLLAGLFSIDAHAGAVSPDLHSGMRGGDDRAVRSSDGGASRPDGIDCMSNPESCLHKAAWYQDRDNSMSPVSPEEGVGAAMATFWTLNGFSQGIQVCPGVYLATAHGVLDDPLEARKANRPLRGPLQNSVTVAAYPINPENVTRASQSDSQFVSPRIGNPSAWRDPSTDYVFVRVDKSIRPNNFVRPITSSDQRLFNASISGKIDVHLYRPQTRFNTDSNGTPDFNSQTLSQQTANDVAALYQQPMRVNEPCKKLFDPIYSLLIGSNCPTEQGVSGSSYVINSNNENYLLGLHISGDPNSYEKFSDDSVPNGFIQSSHFCKDYESVCGQPCAELDEVLPQ